MGIKGDKLSQNSVISADLLVEKLGSIGDISSKKMFGGHGIFHAGKMFGIIDSKGAAFLKADESNVAEFQKYKTEKHSKMPYYSLPTEVFEDSTKLLAIVKQCIAISK